MSLKEGNQADATKCYTQLREMVTKQCYGAHHTPYSLNIPGENYRLRAVNKTENSKKKIHKLEAEQWHDQKPLLIRLTIKTIVIFL